PSNPTDPACTENDPPFANSCGNNLGTGKMAYGVPADNPFANGGNVGGATGRPDIFAWAVRNVWRWSFDRSPGAHPVGAMIGGDVGQDAFDSLYSITKGANFGWSILESNHCSPMHRGCNVNDLSQFAGRTKTPPLLELPHSNLVHSVTAGFVYHGTVLK